MFEVTRIPKGLKQSPRLGGNVCKHYFFSLVFWNPAPPGGLLQGVCCCWVFQVYWTPFAMTGSMKDPNFAVVGYFTQGNFQDDKLIVLGNILII
jgi:hypothetical protein